MKTTIQLLFMVITAVIFMPACKKDKAADGKSRFDLLTQKDWRFIEINTTNLSTGETRDDYTATPACSRDNIMRFTSDFVHEYTEGATKCNPADPQIIYFATWAFKNNESIIEISSGAQRIEFKILELTDFEMKVEASNDATRQAIKFIH